MTDKAAVIQKIQKECKNIGTKTAPMLYEIGIRKREDLITMGAEEAYFQIWKSHPTMTIHPLYLWALEGAIEGIDYREIPEQRKKDFKKFVQELKNALTI